MQAQIVCLRQKVLLFFNECNAKNIIRISSKNITNRTDIILIQIKDF